MLLAMYKLLRGSYRTNISRVGRALQMRSTILSFERATKILHIGECRAVAGLGIPTVLLTHRENFTTRHEEQSPPAWYQLINKWNEGVVKTTCAWSHNSAAAGSILLRQKRDCYSVFFTCFQMSKCSFHEPVLSNRHRSPFLCCCWLILVDCWYDWEQRQNDAQGTVTNHTQWQWLSVFFERHVIH